MQGLFANALAECRVMLCKLLIYKGKIKNHPRMDTFTRRKPQSMQPVPAYQWPETLQSAEQQHSRCSSRASKDAGESARRKACECRAARAASDASDVNEKKQIPRKAARLDKLHGMCYTAKH